MVPWSQRNITGIQTLNMRHQVWHFTVERGSQKIKELLNFRASTSYIDWLYDLLEPWEAAAKEHLLTRPALHVDETGFRVNKKNWWLHVTSDGSLTLKFLHRKRGKEAIDSFGIIPFYAGVLIHDRWAPYFAYKLCKHQVCGSHLLRDITFAVDSNNYRWARLMKKLLRESCDEVNKREN